MMPFSLDSIRQMELPVLRVAAAPYAPFATACGLVSFERQRDCQKPGSHHELLSIIMHFLNVSHRIRVFHADPVDWGRLVNGTWRGLSGLVANDTVDTVSSAYVLTQVHTRHFDFTIPIMQNDNVFILKRKRPAVFNTAMVFLKVFQPIVSMLIIGSVMALLAAMVLIRLVGRSSQRQGGGPSYGLGSVSIGQKPIAAVLGLSAALFMGLYQGALLTQLLRHPGGDWNICSGYDLAKAIKSKQLTFVSSSPQYWFYQEMETSNVTVFKALHESTRSSFRTRLKRRRPHC